MSEYQALVKAIGDVVVSPEDVSSNPRHEKLMIVVHVHDRGEGEPPAHRYVVHAMCHDGHVCKGASHDFGKVQDAAPRSTLALAEAWRASQGSP